MANQTINETERASTALATIRERFEEALQEAGLAYDRSLVTRFLASCLTKPFVILTGLSGAGKTKLAQALAKWLSGHIGEVDPFHIGFVMESARSRYEVTAAESLAIEITTVGNGTKIVLPRGVIKEWADWMRENGTEIGSDPLKDIIRNQSEYGTYEHYFHTQTKLAARTYLEANPTRTEGEATESTPDNFEIIPVGSDWTSRDPILGYPDALNPQRYVKTAALDLILRAKDNLYAPYFLILDEMNLSHVERYFADILSALESGEPIILHSDAQDRDGVPPKIEKWPSNLLIIGTVNVDETTYMFSPKVLDRANVIEFAVEEEEMAAFLDQPFDIRLENVEGKGIEFSEEWVRAAQEEVPSTEETKAWVKEELLLFFQALKRHGVEFGFRAAKEMARFISLHEKLTGEDWRFEDAMDAQLVQKVLPKLHGSRGKLEPVLRELAVLSFEGRESSKEELVEQAKHLAASYEPVTFRGDPLYPISHAKIMKMLKSLEENGFTSFSEA